VSEIFLSLQGEGPSAGTPATFIRLQGCDVGCHWCDTRYAWEFGGGRPMGFDQMWAEARALGESPLLVVTGGEPFEDPAIHPLLLEALDRWPRVEVETSGIIPTPFRDDRLFFNVSPKLPSVTPRWAETWRHAHEWSEEPNTTFKLVVGDPPDPDDAERMIVEHSLPLDRVMLMPEGLTEDRLRARAPMVAELCKRLRVRMSPRLHIWMWGARRGV